MPIKPAEAGDTITTILKVVPGTPTIITASAHEPAYPDVTVTVQCRFGGTWRDVTSFTGPLINEEINYAVLTRCVVTCTADFTFAYEPRYGQTYQ